MSFVQGGVAVAGAVPNGGEVVIRQAEETVYEDHHTTKQVCENEYDSLTGEYEYKCRLKPTTERRPVTKTYYQVSGQLHSRQANVYGAFAQATGIGAHRWRTVP